MQPAPSDQATGGSIYFTVLFMDVYILSQTGNGLDAGLKCCDLKLVLSAPVIYTERMKTFRLFACARVLRWQLLNR